VTDIHSSLLEYYFRILNTERISPPPLHSFQRVKRLRYRGAWLTTTICRLQTICTYLLTIHIQ